MKKQHLVFAQYLIAWVLILFGLYLTRLYSYLLFHSIAELFSIVVAVCIFILMWNSRRFLDNNYLLFIGVAYLFVACLDLTHTLAYKGMGIFQGYTANLTTQLWIAARYIEGISLVIAPLFIGRRLKVKLVFILYAAACVLLLGSIFGDIFPDCYTEGVGLTPFKKISEYVISLILLASVVLLVRVRRTFDKEVFVLLAASIMVTIASELSFTLYRDVYGFFNMIGHYFKIISFYLIYRALIQTGLVKPYGLLFRDLKQSEEMLRKSEARYHAIIEDQVELICRFTTNGTITFVNEAYCQYFGKNRDQLVGSKFNALIPEGTHETLESHFSTFSPHNPVITEERRSIGPDDRMRWQQWTIRAIYGSQDQVLEFQAVGRDITDIKRMEEELLKARNELEQRVEERTTELAEINEQLKQEAQERGQAEVALRDSEGKYSTLVESSLTGIFMVQDGKISFANNQFAETHDYSREELIGMDELLLVDEEYRPLVETMRQKRLKGEQVPSIYEVRALKKGGEPMWVQRRIALTDYKGKPAILGNSVDITKRKRAEEELQQSEKQLRFLSSRLLTAQEEERERIARELHDGIGQSLSAIKFRVENALEELDREGTGSGVTLLNPIVPVVQGAVEEVRRIARNLRPSILDDLGVLATVTWLCREFETIYSGIRIEKQVDIREEKVPEALKIVIYRILQEALNNVAKHSKADLVRLSLRAQKDRVELSVTDNGVGFDVVDAISGERQGGGLGLASMKERGELSGGSFSVESHKGTGTTIRASWPREVKR